MVIITRDGKTLNLGDTYYYCDSADEGYWADSVALMQHLGEEGYSVSLYNGDEGAIVESTLDADAVEYWEEVYGN